MWMEGKKEGTEGRRTSSFLDALRRLRILADLHWKLPRPLTAAEVRLRDITLPGLEAVIAKLQLTLEVPPPHSLMIPVLESLQLDAASHVAADSFAVEAMSW